jgi:hypothetical protein
MVFEVMMVNHPQICVASLKGNCSVDAAYNFVTAPSLPVYNPSQHHAKKYFIRFTVSIQNLDATRSR